ncbi:MAG: hypothetical protein FI718_06870 [SAR202 cluster bacterium]|nr:hypothetical protein [SAR202 cluster bacterium]|tara:strand:+ start:3575 stop:4282 length:708 start_codon:yes stop_codon:yes gene_type:complete
MKKYMLFIKIFLPVIAITLAILGSNSQTYAATTALDATLASLKTEVSQALAQANLAKSATTLAEKQSYAKAAAAKITGAGGVLALASAASVQSQGALDSATASEDADAIAYTTTINNAIANVSSWSAISNTAAGSVSNAGSTSLADIYIGPGGDTLISGLEASLNGWGSHPGISQAESASASLSGVDTTVSIPAATLPSTGGQPLDMAIMLLALFGLIFIGTGTTIAYAYSKSKA